MASNALVDRIAANPNPRSWRGRVLMSVAWGRALNREALVDSFRNVFAVLGVGTVLADFGTMRAWLVAPCVVCFFGAVYADYLRHEGVQ